MVCDFYFRGKSMSENKRSSRGRTADGSPNPIDVHVGARVKMRRSLLGMSQEKLGELIGLTFQQVQKYERGMNRISASRLFDISKVLEVPIGFFFEEMDEQVEGLSPRKLADAPELSEEAVPFNYDPMTKKETLDLVRYYYAIQDRRLAKRLFEMIKAMACQTEDEFEENAESEE